MTTNVGAVIVDLDGTLLTIEERFYQVFNDVLERFGRRKISRRSFLSMFHNNRLYFLPFGSGRQNRSKTRSFWRAFLTSYGKRRYAKLSRPINGAQRAVEWIKKRGIKVAVISGRVCSPSLVRQELRDIDVDQYVDVVVTKATALRSAKLDQTTSRTGELREVLKRLGANARESVFVADYVEDIRSARSLGIMTVGVLSGSSTLRLLKRENPDYIIKSIRDFPSLLKTNSMAQKT